MVPRFSGLDATLIGDGIPIADLVPPFVVGPPDGQEWARIAGFQEEDSLRPGARRRPSPLRSTLDQSARSGGDPKSERY